MQTTATLLKAGCDAFLGRRVTKSFSNALDCITSKIPDIATRSTQYTGVAKLGTMSPNTMQANRVHPNVAPI